MSDFKRILVPCDGSEVSNRALVSALQLARDGGGQVRLLHVLDQLDYFAGGYEYVGASVLEELQRQARKVIEDAAAICQSAGVPYDSVLLDEPGGRLGDKVAEQALAWDADLVVVGTHGRKGLSRAMLGSGAEQIVRFAPVPVLVVREKARR
jgi:nucleotide-binding universal stress UspA family protein